MERIRIGLGPDFCMTRGLELINYRVKVTGIHNRIEFKPRIIVDRSFAMILKKVRQNLPVDLKDLILDEEELSIQNQRFLLRSCKQQSQFEVKLYLPDDLKMVQLNNIIEFLMKNLK